MYHLITEGKAKIYTPKIDKISKDLPVFYNSEMQVGRDVALEIIRRTNPQSILDAMAGSGVRTIRILKETKCDNIIANDKNPLAIQLMKKNAKINNVKFGIEHKDANILLREEPFDYIDIDPFGSPSFYMESAFAGIRHNGIVALTATDLGCLYGKYKNACKKKYSATPLYCSFKNEIGLRILIAKSQKVAAKYDKACFPIFCHATGHYVRVYLKVFHSKSLTHKILKKQGYIQYCPICLEIKTDIYPYEKTCCQKMLIGGSLWLGHLYDERISQDFPLIKYIDEESKIHSIGYYHVPTFSKKYKKPKTKKIQNIIEEIISLGYQASRTHLHPQGIKSTIPKKEFLNII